MPLHGILDKMDKPVPPETIKKLVEYMKGMPPAKEELVAQCAIHLEKEEHSLGAVLAVVHALNDGDIMLHCIDEDIETDLANDFDDILGIDNKKN